MLLGPFEITLRVNVGRVSMKLDTLGVEGRHEDRTIAPTTISGMLIIVVLWLLYYAGRFFADKFCNGHFLMLLSKIIAGIFFSWLVGHIVTGFLCDSIQCGCDYEYRYVWTEWWHKKHCLSDTLNPK